MNDLTVLVGNGLSIAFNPDLALKPLTTQLLRVMEDESAGAESPVTAIRNLARQALPEGATTADDFEVLVGAVAAQEDSLAILESLAAAMATEDHDAISSSLQRVQDFTRRVRDISISHILEAIGERSHARMDLSWNLYQLLLSIHDAFDGRIVYGNLNYDAILLSGLLETAKKDLADLGDGRHSVPFLSSTVTILRKDATFPRTKRIRLLHLHGSLTYWGIPESPAIGVKLTTEFIRAQDLWRRVRHDPELRWRPLVVLTSQREKSAHVERYPFNLAYAGLAGSLADTNWWLVMGYSFRDQCVNELLRREFSRREIKPKVLIVTYGDELLREDVEFAFGWAAEDQDSSDWLSISREGADAMPSTQEWAAFIP